jgi:hypothetical protein
MAKRIVAHSAPDYKVRKDLVSSKKMPGGALPTPRPFETAKDRIASGKRRVAGVESSLKGRLPKYRSASETLAKRGLDKADTDAERGLRMGSARAGMYKSAVHKDSLADAMGESVKRRTGARAKTLEAEIGREKAIAGTTGRLRSMASAGSLGGSGSVPGSIDPMDSRLSSLFGKTAGGAFGYTPYKGPTGVKKSRVGLFK